MQEKNITYPTDSYRGVKEVLGTSIILPDAPGKQRTPYEKQKLRKGFRRRAAIEPIIGHLKQDHRLSRNFYKGIKGDNINVMLAAAALNFKRMMNIWKVNPLLFLWRFWQTLFGRQLTIHTLSFNFFNPKMAF